MGNHTCKGVWERHSGVWLRLKFSVLGKGELGWIPGVNHVNHVGPHEHKEQSWENFKQVVAVCF